MSTREKQRVLYPPDEHDMVCNDRRSLFSILSGYATSTILPPFDFDQPAQTTTHNQVGVFGAPATIDPPPRFGLRHPVHSENCSHHKSSLVLARNADQNKPLQPFGSPSRTVLKSDNQTELSDILSKYATSDILPPYDFHQRCRCSVSFTNFEALRKVPNLEIEPHRIPDPLPRLHKLRTSPQSLWKPKPLYTLPPELLHSICELLEPTDIQAFRQVCRLSSVVGLEHLGTTAYLWCKPSSFKNLVDLSNSSLSRNLKTLQFLPDRFDVKHTYEEWLESEQFREWSWPQRVRASSPITASLSTNTSNPLARRQTTIRSLEVRSCNDPDPDERLEAWFYFRQYCTELAHMDRDNVQQEAIFVLFEKCPKIDTIRLHYCWRIDLKVGHAFGDVMLSPAYEEDPATGFRALVDVMTAAGRSKTKLKSVRTGRFSLASFQPGSDEMTSINEAMNSLEVLTLDLSHEGSSIPAGEMARELLGAAPNLQHLKLDLPEFMTVNFDEFVGHHTFHNLRSLYLDYFSSSFRGLQNFLIGHKNTLKYIRLGNGKLNDRTWDGFFQIISTKLPHLRKFMLRGCFEEQNHILKSYPIGPRSWKSCILAHAMNKFIRKGGPFPTQDDRRAITHHIPNPKWTDPSRKHLGNLQQSVFLQATDIIDNPDTDTEDTGDDHPGLDSDRDDLDDYVGDSDGDDTEWL